MILGYSQYKNVYINKKFDLFCSKLDMKNNRQSSKFRVRLEQNEPKSSSLKTYLYFLLCQKCSLIYFKSLDKKIDFLNSSQIMSKFSKTGFHKLTQKN